MKYILKIITDQILNNEKYRYLNVSHFEYKEYSKAIYENSNVYEKNIAELIFLVDTGKWFDETLRFEICMCSNKNLLEIKKGYTEDYTEYQNREYKNAALNIIFEIENFQNKNRLNNNEGCVNYEY